MTVSSHRGSLNVFFCLGLFQAGGVPWTPRARVRVIAPESGVAGTQEGGSLHFDAFCHTGVLIRGECTAWRGIRHVGRWCAVCVRGVGGLVKLARGWRRRRRRLSSKACVDSKSPRGRSGSMETLLGKKLKASDVDEINYKVAEALFYILVHEVSPTYCCIFSPKI